MSPKTSLKHDRQQLYAVVCEDLWFCGTSDELLDLDQGCYPFDQPINKLQLFIYNLLINLRAININIWL